MHCGNAVQSDFRASGRCKSRVVKNSNKDNRCANWKHEWFKCNNSSYAEVVAKGASKKLELQNKVSQTAPKTKITPKIFGNGKQTRNIRPRTWHRTGYVNGDICKITSKQKLEPQADVEVSVQNRFEILQNLVERENDCKIDVNSTQCKHSVKKVCKKGRT